MTDRNDYRQSHLSRGAEYHRMFSENPYRSMVWAFEKQVLREIVRKLPVQSTLRHLDFACGTGRIAAELRVIAEEQGVTFESTGIDVSASMLQIARETAGRDVEFIEGDLTRENVLKGRSFDLITAFRFFPNAQAGLREEAINALTSVLATNGQLVFNNHKLSSSILYRGAALAGKDVPTMSTSEVHALVGDAQLNIVRQYSFGVIPAYENFRPLPCALLAGLERLLQGVRVVRRFASNQIYVCEHRV